MNVIHTLNGTALIEYKNSLKNLIDISCKFIKSGQVVRVYNYFDTALKLIYPVLYISNPVKFDGDIDNEKMKVIITCDNIPKTIDLSSNVQYTPRSTAKVLSKHIVTMAVVIENVQEFRKSLDSVTELELLKAKSNRELPKIVMESVTKYGCSFSNDYPDSHNDQNRTESILYGGYPTNYIEIFDESDVNKMVSSFSKTNVYTIPQLSLKLRLVNYPIKFTKIIVKKYLVRYFDGLSVTMVNSEMSFKGCTVHITHVK